MKADTQKEEEKKEEESANAPALSTREQPNADTGLLSCPFCGGFARFGLTAVWCDGCGIEYRQDALATKDSLREQWNQRVPQTSTVSTTPTATKESQTSVESPKQEKEERNESSNN